MKNCDKSKYKNKVDTIFYNIHYDAILLFLTNGTE